MRPAYEIKNRNLQGTNREPLVKIAHFFRFAQIVIF